MSAEHQAGWWLVLLGLFIVVVGLLWMFVPGVSWLGRLPGDIRIERDGFRLYIPITSCLVVSVILSALFWLVRWFSSPR